MASLWIMWPLLHGDYHAYNGSKNGLFGALRDVKL